MTQRMNPLKPIPRHKRFVALARVSSREQEREGFSLDVQEQALRLYADRNGGEIVRFYRLAETASKTDERTTFKEMIAYVKANAAQIDGLLFYKVDRAARNLFDYVELERLEKSYGIPFISVSQPTEDSPAGRLNRRVLASMASFYTEQQSKDVREGLAKRVESGLFVGLTPYGYKNLRVDGRSKVITDPDAAKNVRLVFDLYAYHHHTLDSLADKLNADGVVYTQKNPTWPRSKLHTILRDRAYIGEIKFKEQWLPGAQPPLIERSTWDCVQVKLGEKIYKSHELTFAGELIKCGFCGGVVTGEAVLKKQTGKIYTYYRCSNYKRMQGHPSVRLTEQEIDDQIVGLYRSIRQPDEVRDMFLDALRDWSQDEDEKSRQNTDDVQRQLSLLQNQQEQLLNLRLLQEIDGDTFSRKSIELRDRIGKLKAQLQSNDGDRSEQASLAAKVFELSQALEQKWVGAEYPEKRQMLDLVCLNFSLDDVSLVAEMRKPFNMLAEGPLVLSSRGDKI
jgi:site-specific DNA recombinase